MFCFTVFQIGDGHGPGVIRVTFKSTDFGIQLQRKVRFFLQRCHQLTRNFPVVHVSTDFSAGRGNLLFRVATFHDQRRPLFNLRMIFGVTHTAEQRALLQRGIAGAQEIDVIIAPDKAHVRNGINKRVWFVQNAALYLMRPELAGNLEGFVNVDCLFDADGTIGFFRRVVQFHQRGVACSGVVPAVGTLLCNPIQSLNHGH